MRNVNSSNTPSSTQDAKMIMSIAGYLGKQFREIRTLRFGFIGHKIRQFRYINPLAGLIFTLTKKYYETEGCKFLIPKKLTTIVYRSQFYYDLFEKEERQLIREFIQADDRVLELGACIGIVSCLTNRRLLHTPEKHVVVEPNPNLVPYIEKNRQLNNCKFNIERCMIADEMNPSFYVDKQITRGSAQQEADHNIEVKACRVAELEKRYGEFDVLIMDIQGGEAELLQLEKDALAHFRLVVVEMHPHIIGEQLVEDCRQLLRGMGFELQKVVATVEAWQRK